MMPCHRLLGPLCNPCLEGTVVVPGRGTSSKAVKEEATSRGKSPEAQGVSKDPCTQHQCTCKNRSSLHHDEAMQSKCQCPDAAELSRLL
jgi:hypothetical protein